MSRVHKESNETQNYGNAFGATTGKCMSCGNTLQKALRTIGIKFNMPRADGLHLLRHSSGSLIYRRSGGDLKKTQEWLGHSSERITLKTYVHLLKDHERSSADDLSRAVFAPPSTPVTGQIN